MNDSYAFPVPCSRPAISSAGVLPLMLVKSTLRIILFFLFLAILAVAQDWLIGYGLRTIETSKFGSLNRIMSGRVNADVLIIGSSRALSHYDPRIIQSIFGGTAYNIGMDALQIDSQLALLRTYLKHNTAPEIVILNLDLFSFEATKSGEIYDPARYVPYLYEKELYEPLHRIDANVWRWKNIPLYGYTVEDMSFTWVWGVLSCLGINPAEDYFLGFNPKNTRWTDDFERFRAEHPQGVTYSISDRGLQAFRDLIRTCRNKRIEIVLVYSPDTARCTPLRLTGLKLWRCSAQSRRSFTFLFGTIVTARFRIKESFSRIRNISMLRVQAYSLETSQIGYAIASMMLVPPRDC